LNLHDGNRSHAGRMVGIDAHDAHDAHDAPMQKALAIGGWLTDGGFFSARRPTIVHQADSVIGSLNERSRHHRRNLRCTVRRSCEHVARYTGPLKVRGRPGPALDAVTSFADEQKYCRGKWIFLEHFLYQRREPRMVGIAEGYVSN
jgi:hypothetical protein